MIAEVPAVLWNYRDWGDRLVDEWLQTITGQLTPGQNLVIVPEQTKNMETHLTRDLLKWMSVIVTRLLERIRVSELFIEGGSTASAIIREAGWKRFVPFQELARGVVRMKIEERPDIFLTVKPGSYPWPANLWFNEH